jgi:hypothetical protein
MNSINSAAEAGQPKQNKHGPNADDPILDPRSDCELLMLLLRMTLPTPKTVIRPSSARADLLAEISLRLLLRAIAKGC